MNELTTRLASTPRRRDFGAVPMILSEQAHPEYKGRVYWETIPPGVRLVMPNPAFEGIARQIKASLGKAGGEALTRAVYETKVRDGSTILTHIHHRQTPLLLMQGVAAPGVTWQSEALFQEQAGHPIEHIAIPAADNTTAIYGGAEVKGAAHPEAAQAWLGFIRWPAALAIFERYGFKPYTANN